MSDKDYFYKWAVEEITNAKSQGHLFVDECFSLVNKYKDRDWIGVGRNRAVFKEKWFVVKVPLNEFGVVDNEHEARIYKKWAKNTNTAVQYARCRLCGLLLIMEYIIPVVNALQKLPRWTNYIDCSQVGYNRQGLLKAYDYGRF